MELIAFRIRMYKGIIDSGWVDVNNLTVLVGKNESGKTSLLKALHKFNPDSSEPYDIQREWPRGHPSKPNEEQVVCQVRFRLSAREKAFLSRTTAIPEFPDTVEVSRNYAGQLEVKFEGEISSDELQTIDFDKFIGALPRIRDEFGFQFRQRADRCVKDVTRLVREGESDSLDELTRKQDLYLAEGLSSSDSEREIEIDFIRQYRRGLQNLIRELGQLPAIRVKVNRYVTNHLPKFIYMDDYRVFSGTARLDEIQSRRDEDKLTEADKTFLTILELSELDLDKLVQLGEGDGEKVTQRYYERKNGAATLTKLFSNHLRQRNYEVAYQADGHHFLTFVKDNVDSTPIKLEERSKGFQWFFSFDLMFMHGSEKTFKGSVVLLDEPGLHLHPGAQKDLLCRLEEYAKENTFLYTTHLPFMIDLKHPDRIRILEETGDNGIDVTTNLVKNTSDARLVFQTALGMDASQSFIVADRNLVVEGVDDYWILTELSNLLQRDKTDGLPEDVHITPGPSASEAVRVATFMIGQNLDVVALFDSDKAGQDAKDLLVKQWITGYKKESHTDAILLGGAVGVDGDYALEDLFTEDFYMECVKKTYQDVNEITLQSEGMLWKRVEGALKEKGIKKPNKGSVAKRLRNRLSNMKDASDLPPETKERAIKLFQTIRKAFGEK
jgi:energy-coupling factor transporter ATP-binding protein EcfA2